VIEIVSTGGMTTVQDAGRHGHRRLGVSVGGALDVVAATVANRMVGNPDDAAFLEIAIFPLRVRFGAAARIALTGADANAELDGQRLPPWWSAVVQPGQVLVMRTPSAGGVGYLAVAGGIDVPVVMGSRSTDLKACFGGLDGRPLRKGDRLAVGAGHRPAGERRYGVVPPFVALAAPRPLDAPLTDERTTTVRVLPAAQWSAFPPAVRKQFLGTRWSITPDSNRIGLRLSGPALHTAKPLELLSHGIVPGVVQVPPNGQPIVMQCDAQTAGGYPKIATVIEADQWRVAQAGIGNGVCFVEVDRDEALRALEQLKHYLARVQRAIDTTS
jgi:biotin-dependent carboxylase-like uncharacterized protein